MWRIASSARLRWNRLSIVRVIATNGVPLSVMSSCGTPHSSIASSSSARIASRLLGRDGPDPEQEPAVVVDEGDEVAGPGRARRADEVERTLEVDVPELVGRARS